MAAARWGMCHAIVALSLLSSLFNVEAKRSPLDKVFAYSKLRDKEPVTIRLDEALAAEQEGADSVAADEDDPFSSSPMEFTKRIGKGEGGVKREDGMKSIPSSPSSSSLYIYEHRIPRIIHQMWKTNRIQRVFAEYVQSWIRLHPFWEYRFWTDESGEEFIKSVYPWFWGTFKDFNGIQRSDALRYFILHQYGGVYADLDVEPVVPLDRILNQTLTLSQEPLAHAVVLENRERQVCNAFMASPPNHPFWPFVHRYMKDHQVRKDPVGSTGPRMLDAALNAYRKKIRKAQEEEEEEEEKKMTLMTKKNHANTTKTAGAKQGSRSDDRIIGTNTTMRTKETSKMQQQQQQRTTATMPSESVKGNSSQLEAEDVAEWEDVFVGAPEVYMPLFDDKLNDFSQKCGYSWRLSERQKAYCKELRKRNFENRIEATTLTVHHWSHTWLGHVTSEDFVDVWELVNTTRSRYLANTHHASELDRNNAVAATLIRKRKEEEGKAKKGKQKEEDGGE